MNKRFLIEQCSRLERIHEEESEELKREDKLNDKWLIIHNDGHNQLIKDFVALLNNIDNCDKREIKKWLNKKIKKSNDVIKKLDEKYNYFNNDEFINDDDERIYHMNDGVICISYTLMNIVGGKGYISKLSE